MKKEAESGNVGPAPALNADFNPDADVVQPESVGIVDLTKWSNFPSSITRQLDSIVKSSKVSEDKNAVEVDVPKSDKDSNGSSKQ